MKLTKEHYMKECAKLAEQLRIFESRDQSIRENFRKLLNIHAPREPYSIAREIPSWEQIFFTVGELNSDANYTILLEEKRRLEIDIQALQQKLDLEG